MTSLEKSIRPLFYKTEVKAVSPLRQTVNFPLSIHQNIGRRLGNREETPFLEKEESKEVCREVVDSLLTKFEFYCD